MRETWLAIKKYIVSILLVTLIILILYVFIFILNPDYTTANNVNLIVTPIVTIVGFVLVLVSIQGITDTNKAVASNQKFQFYMTRIQKIANEARNYKFNNYYFYNTQAYEKIAPQLIGLHNLKPVFDYYFSLLSIVEDYQQDLQKISDIYISEDFADKSYSYLVNDLMRIRNDLIHSVNSGYLLLFEIQASKDIYDYTKNLLFAEILSSIMAEYINICYIYSLNNNIYFPQKSGGEVDYFFNTLFYNTFFSITQSKTLVRLMRNHLLIVIQQPRLEDIKNKYKIKHLMKKNYLVPD